MCSLRYVFAALCVAFCLVSTTGAEANCDANLKKYNALIDTYKAKLKEADVDDDARRCSAGRDVKPIILRMKAAADGIRGCNIKGGVESPAHYDALIQLAEFTYESGCPGVGMEKCPEYVDNLSDQIDQLMAPYDKFDVDKETAEAICAQGKAIEEAAGIAERAIVAVETKCAASWEQDDIEAYANGRLVELSRMQIQINANLAEHYKTKCQP